MLITKKIIIHLFTLIVPFVHIAQNELENQNLLQNPSTPEDYLKTSKYYLSLNKTDSVTKYTSLGKSISANNQETLALLHFTESLNSFEKGNFK